MLQLSLKLLLLSVLTASTVVFATGEQPLVSQKSNDGIETSVTPVDEHQFLDVVNGPLPVAVLGNSEDDPMMAEAQSHHGPNAVLLAVKDFDQDSKTGKALHKIIEIEKNVVGQIHENRHGYMVVINDHVQHVEGLFLATDGIAQKAFALGLAVLITKGTAIMRDDIHIRAAAHGNWIEGQTKLFVAGWQRLFHRQILDLKTMDDIDGNVANFETGFLVNTLSGFLSLVVMGRITPEYIQRFFTQSVGRYGDNHLAQQDHHTPKWTDRFQTLIYWSVITAAMTSDALGNGAFAHIFHTVEHQLPVAFIFSTLVLASDAGQEMINKITNQLHDSETALKSKLCDLFLSEKEDR